MAGEMESYCKRQLDETYRPGHTAVIIDELVEDAMDHKPTVIAGDFNAWAQEWGSDTSKRSSSDAVGKGDALLEAFAALDVVLLNHGTVNTFNRGGFGSVIDLTFVTSSLSHAATWHMCNHYTASDHEALVFSLGNRSGSSLHQATRRLVYRPDTLQIPLYLEVMDNMPLAGSAQQMATQLSSHITLACDACMSQTKPFRGTRPSTYWWNNEIAAVSRP
ncbi:hypothetical protein ACLKA6_005774 [Drosophila palustris]